MEEKAKQVAELLKVLANQNRLLIVCALIEEPLTVSELGSFVPNISQSALSQHLAVLKANGILDNQKNGQHITYFLADQRITELISTLKTHYC